MRFLSDEWIAALAAPDAPPLAGAFTGEVLTIVTGGPDGEVRYLTTYEDGRPTEARSGDDGAWQVSLTITHADARALLVGDGDLNALFISGRMKVAGERTADLVELLKASKSPVAQAARAELAAATTV